MNELASLFYKFDGVLSLEEISRGIIFCLDNATTLLYDAEILLKAGRYARSLSLILTAFQEAGKVAILQRMTVLPPDQPEKWKKLWKHFVDHREKDFLGYSVKLSSEYNTQPGEAFWQQLIYKSKFASAKEKIRQMCLYVDYIPDENRWWSPEELTKELVETAFHDITQALYKLAKERQIGMFSPKALQIYGEEFKNFAPEIKLNQQYILDEKTCFIRTRATDIEFGCWWKPIFF
jgi:AbiV family abortive infection protein